jgi:hypothetical protein
LSSATSSSLATLEGAAAPARSGGGGGGGGGGRDSSVGGRGSDGAAAAAVRRTHLVWDDAARKLSWSVQGPASFGPGATANDYTSLRVAFHAPNASTVVRTAPQPIGTAGSVVVP